MRLPRQLPGEKLVHQVLQVVLVPRPLEVHLPPLHRDAVQGRSADGIELPHGAGRGGGRKSNARWARKRARGEERLCDAGRRREGETSNGRERGGGKVATVTTQRGLTSSDPCRRGSRGRNNRLPRATAPGGTDGASQTPRGGCCRPRGS